MVSCSVYQKLQFILLVTPISLISYFNFPYKLLQITLQVKELFDWGAKSTRLGIQLFFSEIAVVVELNCLSSLSHFLLLFPSNQIAKM